MRIIVKVRNKVPIEEYTSKMIQEIESKIDDILYVRSSEFDPKLGKIYIDFVDPTVDSEDDQEMADSVDRGAFRNAINHSEYFTFVGISV